MPTVHLLARAVVRDSDHVLVVQADGQSHTFLPGGHREPGEDLAACLRRELREELGVEAKVEQYVGGVEHTWRRDGEQQYEINHCFAVSSPLLTADTAPRAREDYLSFDWVPETRLEAVSLEPTPLRTLLAHDVDAESPWWASTLDKSFPQGVGNEGVKNERTG